MKTKSLLAVAIVVLTCFVSCTTLEEKRIDYLLDKVEKLLDETQTDRRDVKLEKLGDKIEEIDEEKFSTTQIQRLNELGNEYSEQVWGW